MKTAIKPIQVLRYMGNKTKIRHFLIKKILENIKPNEIILDLMAGTHAIGYSLKDRNRIMSNDVQKYSFVIGKALIENNTYLKVEENDIEEIKKNYENHLKILKRMRQRFVKNPYNSDLNNKNHPINKIYKMDHKRMPYCLFSYYFADKYFTLNTCMKIDSLRFAIDKLTESDEDDFRKSFFLICLLYAISYTVLTSGHFAQYRIDKGTKSTSDLKKIKKRDVWEIFLNKSRAVEIIPSDNSNKVFNLDYKELLSNKKYRKFIKDTFLVYLDPPYSTENYSRYYHIAETLVNYDYPACRFKGCYRDDRFKSFFCRKSKVKDEFDNVVKLVSEINDDVKLMVSYVKSKSSIMKVNDIVNICKKYFKYVSKSNGLSYNHSSLGNRAKKVKEFYIFCKN